MFNDSQIIFAYNKSLHVSAFISKPSQGSTTAVYQGKLLYHTISVVLW
jgi:hypothetical protein